LFLDPLLNWKSLKVRVQFFSTTQRLITLFVNAFTLLASAPNPNNYKGFCKRMGCEKFYMPVWSEDESLSCNMSLQKWNVDEEVMIKRLSVCGGNLRFL
jgi:hypothetical protein